MTRAALLASALAVVACSSSHGAPPSTASTPPPSVTPLPSLRVTPESLRALEPFTKDLASKRVVMLGEPDHYVHEKYANQLLWVTKLFAAGFRHVGLEMGRAQGRRFDRYVETGDETWLGMSPRVAKALSMPEGILSTGKAATWPENDGNERSAFFRALRRLSESRPEGTERLSVFGFDVDFFPAMGFVHAGEILEGASGADVEALRAMLVPEGGNDTTRAAKARAFCTERAAALRAALGPARHGELAASLRQLEESARYTDRAMHNPTLPELIAAHADRERTMFWQMDEHLARVRAGTVLGGHLMHLSKASGRIRFGAAGEDPMWRSIGTHLSETYGDAVAGIWMLYGGGTHGGHACQGAACTIVPPDGVVEKELAALGERFLLPLGENARASLRGDVRFMQNGELGSGELARQADLLLFVRDVHAPDDDGVAELDAFAPPVRHPTRGGRPRTPRRSAGGRGAL